MNLTRCCLSVTHDGQRPEATGLASSEYNFKAPSDVY